MLGLFALSFNAFSMLLGRDFFFFSFLPDLVDRKYKALLEGCCHIAGALAIEFMSVDSMKLTSFSF